MFDISDSYEATILNAKKLCNKIEVNVGGCDDEEILRSLFYIYRHLRDVLRELELNDLPDYDTKGIQYPGYEQQRLLLDGLTQRFEKVVNVHSLA